MSFNHWISASRAFGVSLLAAALFTLVSCKPAQDEETIKTIETRLDGLDDKVTTILARETQLSDEFGDLLSRVEAVEKTKITGGGQDFSPQIKDLGLRLQTLQDEMAKTRDSLKTAPREPVKTPGPAAPNEPAPPGQTIKAPASPGPIVTPKVSKPTGTGKPGVTSKSAPKEATAAGTTEKDPSGAYYGPVQPGETFESIAKATNTSVEKLRAANPIPAGKQPLPNSYVWVPGPRKWAGR